MGRKRCSRTYSPPSVSRTYARDKVAAARQGSFSHQSTVASPRDSTHPVRVPRKHFCRTSWVTRSFRSSQALSHCSLKPRTVLSAIRPSDCWFPDVMVTNMLRQAAAARHDRTLPSSAESPLRARVLAANYETLTSLCETDTFYTSKRDRARKGRNHGGVFPLYRRRRECGHRLLY